MARITLDTNVLISATLWDGSVSKRLLDTLIQSDSIIFSSDEIIDEYKEVLTREFDMDEEETTGIIQTISKALRIIRTTSKINHVKADPDDNKILECAIDSRSDHIITYDKHRLTLEEFREIKILKPEQFLEMIRDR